MNINFGKVSGGATVHGGYMLHYTAPNKSNSPRRALILSGGLPATERKTPREYPWQKAKRTARERRSQTFRQASDSPQI